MDEGLYEDRPPQWAKIPLIKQILPNYDWVMWIDSDAMPINFNYDARDFIDEKYDMILAEEELPEGPTINTGIFWIRNSEYMRILLNKIWEEAEDMAHGWAEQLSLIQILEREPGWSQFIKKLPIHPINVNPSKVREDTFIVHLAGGPANPEYKARVLFDLSLKIKL